VEASEIVEKAAKAHKTLDAALTTARNASKQLERLIEEGVKIGMVQGIEGKILIHEARAVTGAIADAGAKSAHSHASHTLVARKQGIDTGTLDKAAGVTPLGGTR
jgi:hypothetical protein